MSSREKLGNLSPLEKRNPAYLIKAECGIETDNLIQLNFFDPKIIVEARYFKVEKGKIINNNNNNSNDNDDNIMRCETPIIKERNDCISLISSNITSIDDYYKESIADQCKSKIPFFNNNDNLDDTDDEFIINQRKMKMNKATIIRLTPDLNNNNNNNPQKVPTPKSLSRKRLMIYADQSTSKSSENDPWAWNSPSILELSLTPSSNSFSIIQSNKKVINSKLLLSNEIDKKYTLHVDEETTPIGNNNNNVLGLDNLQGYYDDSPMINHPNTSNFTPTLESSANVLGFDKINDYLSTPSSTSESCNITPISSSSSSIKKTTTVTSNNEKKRKILKPQQKHHKNKPQAMPKHLFQGESSSSLKENQKLYTNILDKDNNQILNQFKDMLHQGRATRARKLAESNLSSSIDLPIDQKKIFQIFCKSINFDSNMATKTLLQCIDNTDILDEPLETLVILTDYLHADINACDPTAEGRSVLASVFSKPLLGKYLLTRGADPLLMDNVGDSALKLSLDYNYNWILEACESPNQLSIIKKDPLKLKTYIEILIKTGRINHLIDKLEEQELNKSLSSNEAAKLMQSINFKEMDGECGVKTFEFLEKMMSCA